MESGAAFRLRKEMFRHVRPHDWMQYNDTERSIVLTRMRKGIGVTPAKRAAAPPGR